MIWSLAIVGIVLVASCVGCFFISRKLKRSAALVRQNAATLKSEAEQKEQLLSELAFLSLGMILPGEVEKAHQILSSLQEQAREQEGRVTLTQAEIEALQGRLKELEELEKELQSSSAEAAQELEMLKSQEREISSKNSAVKAELDSALTKLDLLLGELSNSRDASERIAMTKAQISTAQTQIDSFTESISLLNTKYFELKKAYDALDIEYAQLYEKQSAAGM